MTIEISTKAFRTKLWVTAESAPEAHKFLLHIAKSCIKVGNMYVETALDMMKKDGITVFSSRKELEKYSPLHLSSL